MPLLTDAPAIFAISFAPAPVFFRHDKDPASLGRHLKALFPLEKKLIRRHSAQIKPALKSNATKGAYYPQIMGVYKYTPLAVVFFTNQINQLPCGTSIKISPGADMEIAIALFELDLKIDAHTFPSLKYPFAFGSSFRDHLIVPASVMLGLHDYLRNSA